MHKFIVKVLQFSLLGITPVSVVLALYLYFDPFKVLYDYESYFDNDKKVTVALNKDFVSTTTFIKNSKDIDYNSFILGNSRSIFFQISDWKQHLPADALCYHFDASGESLWALNKKVEFIDKQGNDIENMLLILDYSILVQDKPKPGHIWIISPPLVNNSNIFEFHRTFFMAFITPRFFYAFFDYKISNKIKPYMQEGFLLDDRQRTYDYKTNELRFDYFEDLISRNKYYTPKRLSVFYKRDTTIQSYSPPSISENQMYMLENIYSILQKHKTDAKVVISPLYNQKKLNSADLNYLQALFGENNVFDFSGINRFTNNYENYYESSHYRPHIAKEIMKVIYENNELTRPFNDN